MPSAVVLLGHGTQDADGVAELLEYRHAIAQRRGGIVTCGVLEYPTARLPDIQTAFDQAVALGASEIIAAPALLFFAGHARDDMPDQVAQAQLRHPSCTISLAGPLGKGPKLLEAIEDRLAPFQPLPATGILLVGRGALNEEANADLFRLARLLWTRNRFSCVEACFISVAKPSVPEGLERLARLGARHAVVVPYFLNTGVLVKRIRVQAHHPHLDVSVADHLGLHPNVLDILDLRIKQAELGTCACLAAQGCRLGDECVARADRCSRGRLAASR